jgi:hypothetical protein
MNYFFRKTEFQNKIKIGFILDLILFIKTRKLYIFILNVAMFKFNKKYFLDN